VSSDCTVGIHNKAKVGKHRIIPYCESYSYCKSQLFGHGKVARTKKCTIVSFNTIEKFLIMSSASTLLSPSL